MTKAQLDLDERRSNLRQGPATLDQASAHKLAETVYEYWINRYKDEPSSQRFWNIEWGSRACGGIHHLFVFPPQHVQFYERAETIQQHCFGVADELLANAGLSADDDSRAQLARAVSAAVHRACVALKKIELGESILPHSSIAARQILGAGYYGLAPILALASPSYASFGKTPGIIRERAF